MIIYIDKSEEFTGCSGNWETARNTTLGIYPDTLPTNKNMHDLPIEKLAAAVAPICHVWSSTKTSHEFAFQMVAAYHFAS